MKLISRKQIETLADFESNFYLTTSFTLDTDKSRLTKKEILLNLKNLLNNNKVRIDEMKLEKEKKESLYQDLKKIKEYCDKYLGAYNSPGLAIFTCHKKDFWQDFILPDPPKNRIVFDGNPYVRPMSAILGQHYRICILTFNRREAKWYDISLGEISMLDELQSDVPGRVKEGGWEGYESKRIERHTATLFRKFLRKIAKKTFELFKLNDFDWLFIGCKDDCGQEIGGLLHSYVKERYKDKIKVNPSDSMNKILKEALILKKKHKKQEQDDIIENYVAEIEKGGLAASGLKNTLRSLNRSEVETLLVTRYFTKPGKICPKCKLLFADEAKCPACGGKTKALIDVMDEAVEDALEKKCRVKHIESPSKLTKFGNIGALLRYKTKA